MNLYHPVRPCLCAVEMGNHLNVNITIVFKKKNTFTRCLSESWQTIFKKKLQHRRLTDVLSVAYATTCRRLFKKKLEYRRLTDV